MNVELQLKVLSCALKHSLLLVLECLLKAANFIAEVGNERLFLGCIFYEVKTVRRVIFKCHVDIDLTQ